METQPHTSLYMEQVAGTMIELSPEEEVAMELYEDLSARGYEREVEEWYGDNSEESEEVSTSGCVGTTVD